MSCQCRCGGPKTRHPKGQTVSPDPQTSLGRPCVGVETSAEAEFAIYELESCIVPGKGQKLLDLTWSFEWR